MLVRVEHISKSYPLTQQGPSVLVLDKISFSVAQGDFICILGPSGCGKSTLLNLIAGFLQPDQGRILFADRPVLAPGSERGVVFQEPTLFPWMTIRQNIELGLRAAGLGGEQVQKKVDDSLALVALHCSSHVYPHQLSGGMKQRVALARVLALDPQLLLMDEPFSALDADTREYLQDQLLDICKSRRQTVLFVTHSVEEAAYLADRVLIMGPPQSCFYTELTIHRTGLIRSREDKNLPRNILCLRTRLKELSRYIPDQ